MVRNTIFWPIIMMPGAALRISPGTWQGATVMCVLGSRVLGDAGHAPTRRWEETEFCIDAKTGLLRTYSIAPGIYAVYHYESVIRFHASTLPKNISIYEGDRSVLEIRLDRLADADAPDQRLFTPSQQMQPQPNATVTSGTDRIPMFGGVSPVPTHGFIQPVIVHASVAADGTVEEAESLQTFDPALSTAALALVKSSHLSLPERALTRQREVFVNVRFMPPSTDGGK
jgi:hypothetical protein